MNPTEFSSFLYSLSPNSLHVLNKHIPKSKYHSIDLSEQNTDLKTFDITSSKAWEQYINAILTKHQAQVLYGGYLEKRTIYKRSTHFNNAQPETERNIHLGLDLWLQAGSKIYAPLDGMVHSFANNTHFGDYGPTLILQHQIKEVTFYTLYGHLSLQSIVNLKEGQKFHQGEIIATLGDASVNGDYAPHLHFQIIRDMQSFKGDFPGVCSIKDLKHFSENCPNPNYLLKIT